MRKVTKLKKKLRDIPKLAIGELYAERCTDELMYLTPSPDGGFVILKGGDKEYIKILRFIVRHA